MAGAEVLFFWIHRFHHTQSIRLPSTPKQTPKLTHDHGRISPKNDTMLRKKTSFFKRDFYEADNDKKYGHDYSPFDLRTCHRYSL
jgi:hypothetical protein